MTNKLQSAYICSATRSPIGSFMGALSSFSSPELGALVLKKSFEFISLKATEVDEVYMGCVLSAGLGQAPARQAALGAGLDKGTPCTTISKVCGSGLKAVMLGDLSIRSGESHTVAVGGMESMSNAPFLIPRLRQGLRMGHSELIDSMIKDGLWDVYNNFHMGTAAELCAKKYSISREAQDQFAINSYKKAIASIENKNFESEICSIEIKSKKGSQCVDKDEEPFKSDLTKISLLKPVFDSSGTVTAANASSLNDGAAALVLMSEAKLKENGVKPLARIVAQAQAAQEPEWFSTAPAKSIKLLLDKASLKTTDIDLWEINEAFASVALVNMQLLDLDPAKVNVWGGAVALGHPIGASGARILVTLCSQLQKLNKKYGVASLCIGGGEAVSVLIENTTL